MLLYRTRWAFLSLQLFLSCSVGYAIEPAPDGVASAEPIPTVLEIYRQFIDQNGGYTNIMRLNTLVVSGRMVDAAGETNEFKLYRKRPDMMRMRFNKQQYYLETIFDGQRGLRRMTSSINGDTREIELSESELEALRMDSSIEGPFFKIGRSAANIDSVQHDTVRSVPAFRIDISPDAESGYTTIWLERETFQEIKLAKLLPVQGSDKLVYEEVLLSDMDQVEGVYFARKMEYHHDGQLVKTMVVDRVRANVGVFDSYFSLE